MITRDNLTDLINHLKTTISDEYRSTIQDSDDDTPTMDVTVGMNDSGEYSWQTGDNSFTGSAYHFPHWAVIYLSSNDDTDDIVNDIVNQLAELSDYQIA